MYTFIYRSISTYLYRGRVECDLCVFAETRRVVVADVPKKAEKISYKQRNKALTLAHAQKIHYTSN